MTDEKREKNHLSEAARDAVERDEMLAKDPEPSLAQRFGQIGILGWMIIAPILAAVFVGHKADHWLHTGITFTTALTMLGAVLGLWLAFRWMHEQ